MSYNTVVIISLLISAIISLLLSYYGVLFFINEDNGFFKIMQLIIAITTMLTTYTPLKFFLLKYMDVDEREN